MFGLCPWFLEQNTQNSLCSVWWEYLMGLLVTPGFTVIMWLCDLRWGCSLSQGDKLLVMELSFPSTNHWEAGWELDIAYYKVSNQTWWAPGWQNMCEEDDTLQHFGDRCFHVCGSSQTLTYLPIYVDIQLYPVYYISVINNASDGLEQGHRNPKSFSSPIEHM